MTKRVIMIAALAAGVARTPAHAEPTCLLEVDSKRYLDGPCTVTEAGAGSWLIVRDRLLGQGATVKVDPIIRGGGTRFGPVLLVTDARARLSAVCGVRNHAGLMPRPG